MVRLHGYVDWHCSILAANGSAWSRVNRLGSTLAANGSGRLRVNRLWCILAANGSGRLRVNRFPLQQFKALFSDTRESAFVHAITAAASVFTLGKACGEERLKCGCKPDNFYSDGRSGVSWQGCHDGVDYGYRKSKEFVDEKDNGDLTSKIRLHNNEAGRRAVTEHMKVSCKCYGWATACGLKSCWKTMPSIRDVGTRLLQKFEEAERVRMTKDGKLQSRWRNKSPEKDTLVYDKNSPNFCEPKKKFGSLGTHGRQCHETETWLGGCLLMCCGRGFIRIEEQNKLENCSCNDNCEECTQIQWVTRCL